MGTKGQL